MGLHECHKEKQKRDIMIRCLPADLADRHESADGHIDRSSPLLVVTSTWGKEEDKA